jgi:hypothetical protein
VLLPSGARGSILAVVTPLLFAVALLVAAVTVLAGSGGLSVRRYSRSHVVAQLAIAGRGLYFSRTADGAWWQLRMRPCRRVCEDRRGWGEPPPDSGVREPRRPVGPGPIAGAVELDAPQDLT